MCAQALAQCGLCACSSLWEPDSGIAVNSKLYEPSGGWLLRSSPASVERGRLYLLYTSIGNVVQLYFLSGEPLRYGVCSCARSGMKKKRSAAYMHRTGKSFQGGRYGTKKLQVELGTFMRLMALSASQCRYKKGCYSSLSMTPVHSHPILATFSTRGGPICHEPHVLMLNRLPGFLFCLAFHGRVFRPPDMAPATVYCIYLSVLFYLLIPILTPLSESQIAARSALILVSAPVDIPFAACLVDGIASAVTATTLPPDAPKYKLLVIGTRIL